MNKARKDQEENENNGGYWAAAVNGAKTMDDMRAVIATLLTGAKAEDVGPSMAARRHTMMTALDTFKWGDSPSGSYPHFLITRDYPTTICKILETPKT